MSAYSLVVDDGPDVAAPLSLQLQRDLKSRWFQLAFAPSGPARFARALDRQDRALILANINTAGSSGPKMLPQMPSKRPHVTMSMITARGDARTRKKTLERAAEKAPTSPVDASLLRGEIKTGLGQAA